MKWAMRHSVWVSFGLTVLIVACALGWHVWMISGSCEPIYWQTADGALSLRHTPGKQLTWLEILTESTSPNREWVLTHAGATDRWLGAIPLPDPEELLAEASIPGEHIKSAAGACQFYPSASRRQKEQILWHLEEMQETSIEAA
jgi:hypothetical protein